MKTLFALAIAVIVLVPAAVAAPCPTGGLNQYLATGFSCTSGNLVFSNFSYAGAAAPPGIVVPAASINVTPILTAGDEGFLFSASWAVIPQAGGVSSSMDSTIFYTVSTSNHQATIDDLYLSFNGTGSGGGTAGVTEQYCLNGTLTNCTAGNLNQIFVLSPGAAPPATVTFSPVSTISVSKDISVTSGTGGFANITTVTNEFSQVTGVPEPASCLMLGAGLLGVGLLRKRARKQ